ncbi:uncharacterized protein ACO6RY_04433 [Pungitius sinensis]
MELEVENQSQRFNAYTAASYTCIGDGCGQLHLSSDICTLGAFICKFIHYFFTMSMLVSIFTLSAMEYTWTATWRSSTP